MNKYSKAFGAVTGAIVAIGGIWGLDFSWMQDPAVQQGLVGLGSLIGTYLFPRNAD